MRRAIPWVALALLLVPFVVAIVVLVCIGGGFHAVADQANDELLVRDVGHHAVLVGPYSRDNWNHLGPAMLYVLAVPYRLFGGSSVGLWIGAVLLNALAVVAIALIARRHGGTSLMVVMLFGCAVVIRALGADFVRDPWNSYLPVLCFGALIFLVWAMTCGDAWALPVGAAVASFCAQTHIGYVTLGVPLFAVGAGWLIWLTVKGRDRGGVRGPPLRRLVRAGVIAAGVLVVMWLPPLVEELTHSPGNLTKVVRYFRHPPGARHTLVEGYRIVFGQFGVVPEWVRGPAPANPLSGEPALMFRAPLPSLFVVFVAGCGLLWLRRRARWGGDERGWRLAAIIALTLVLGVVSIQRTAGAAYDYRMRWTMVVAMMAIAVSVWAAWTLIAPRLAANARRVLLVLSVVPIAAVTGINATAAARAGVPQRPLSSAIPRLGAATLAALPSGEGQVLVEGPDAISGAFSGVVLWLEEHGVAARVEPQFGLGVGTHRVYRQGRLRAIVTVASDSVADEYSLRPDEQLIASSKPFNTSERQRLIGQIADAQRAYREQKATGQETLARLGRLTHQLGHVTAVFMRKPPS